AHDTDAWVLPGQLHHPADAFRVYPVVGLDDLAVMTLPGYVAERAVVVLVLVEQLGVRDESDPGITVRVAPCDRQRIVRTAIVGEDVLEVSVRLGQDAFDAFRQVLRRVIERCDDTHQRTGRGAVHR